MKKKLINVFLRGARTLVRKPRLRGFLVAIFDESEWPYGIYYVGGLKIMLIDNGGGCDVEVLAENDELENTDLALLLDYTRILLACEQCTTEFTLKDSILEGCTFCAQCEAEELAEALLKQMEA